MLASGVANTNVVCAPNELLHFNPSPGQTCQEYLQPYISYIGGYLSGTTRDSRTSCEFCAISSTNTFLQGVSVSYSDRWQNFGILWVYVGVNVGLAVLFYWMARVPKDFKWKKSKKDVE